jgi:hypothetical protein
MKLGFSNPKTGRVPADWKVRASGDCIFVPGLAAQCNCAGQLFILARQPLGRNAWELLANAARHSPNNPLDNPLSFLASGTRI